MFNKEVYSIISGCGSNKARWFLRGLFFGFRHVNNVERKKTNFFAGSAVYFQIIFNISTPS